MQKSDAPRSSTSFSLSRSPSLGNGNTKCITLKKGALLSKAAFILLSSSIFSRSFVRSQFPLFLPARRVREQLRLCEMNPDKRAIHLIQGPLPKSTDDDADRAHVSVGADADGRTLASTSIPQSSCFTSLARSVGWSVGRSGLNEMP